MILSVCLNPALDITYRTDALRPGESHAVEVLGARAGGKGVNVARVLHQQGEPVMVTGLLGGPRGVQLEAELLDAGLPSSFSPISDETRRSVTVLDKADATVFNERGPQVTEAEWLAFAEHFGVLVTGADAVAMSGSQPAALAGRGYAQLIETCNHAGVPSILDTSGHSLALALEARPTVVAPNRTEVAQAIGHPVRGLADLRAAGLELIGRGAGAAIISAGVNGLIAVTSSGAWTVEPPTRIEGNPTGAGDALTAALAAGIHARRDWPGILATAVAWSAAAVACDHAGEIDAELAAEFERRVVVKEF
ncbi:MAG TPA: 1-phosphofructokinase family hexose kinase [Jatrophihabitans sp.]|jgi:tagatose 6-phosphate kinase